MSKNLLAKSNLNFDPFFMNLKIHNCYEIKPIIFRILKKKLKLQ